MSIKLGKLKLGSRPVIAAALSDDNIRLLRPGDLNAVDLIELRVDMFRNLSEDYVKSVFYQARKRFTKPLLCTIRLKSEGGRRAIDEDMRHTLFKALIPLTDIVDIEILSSLFCDVVKFSHSLKKPVIASHHDLKKTPKDDIFLKMLTEAKKVSADITKLAFKANTMNDVSRLLRFTMDHKRENIVTISLGCRGRLSRIINPLFGSLITYGYIGKPKADGQLHVKELATKLRLLNFLVL